MKRSWGLALVFGLVLATVPQVASAQEERVSGTAFRKHLVSMDVWTGYTYLAMGQIMEWQRAQNDANRSYYGSNNCSITEVHSGINSGVDLNFEVVKGLKFGPRLGFIYAFPGTVKVHSPYTGNDYTQSWDGYVIPVAVGVSYSVPPLSRFRCTFGVDTGYAFGVGNWSTKTESFYYGDSTDTWTATSGGFYGNIYAAMRVLFAEAFGMDFKLGYHTASLTNWVISSSSTSGDVGRTVYYRGDPLVIDFSGVDAQLGFSFYF